MRSKTYRTHWSYLGPAIKHRELMVDFVLDTLAFLDRDGIIPPLHVMNEILEYGGNNGGMGPGTTWVPFTMKESEYIELVDALLNLDVENAKKTHPYLDFKTATIDEELLSATDYNDWIAKKAAKYKHS